MRARWIFGLVVSLGLLQGTDAAAQLRTRSPSTTASATTEGASTTFAGSTSPPGRSSTLRVTPGLCLTPSLAQCTNATWLDSACGREEIASGTTCDDLIDAAMQDRASDASPGWVPWSMHPEGVAQVVDGGSMSAGEHYSPDPFVVGSGYVSAEYGMPVPRGFVAPGTLQIEDVYDGWATTSTFQSCEEYVYERYYEIHELLRAVGAESSNALRVVQIAFGPENDRASFGTRHLTSLVVRDVAGAPRHTLAYDSYSPGTFNAMSPKNAFFWLPPHQSTEIPDPGPDLHASIRAYSSAGAAYLDLVASARAEDAPGSANYAQNIYPRTLAYDRWWYTQALFERPRGPAVDHSGSPTDFLPGIGASDGPPAAADDLTDLDDGTPPTAEELLGSVTSVPGMRRYLAKELDELYRVQTQLEELAARWYALNWRFEGSGWRPSALAPTPRTNVGGLTTRSRGGHDTIDDYDSVHSGPPDTAAGGGTFAVDLQGGADTNVGGFAAVDGSETALRRAIVAEIVALLERGADAGCLEPGITPCDWSPAKLADRILRSPDREREREFRRCQSLVDGVAEGSSHPPSLGLMMNLLGETLVFEMPDGSPSCQVTVPTALSPSHVGSLHHAAEACRDAQATAQERVYLQQIEAQTDLWDSATGTVRNPGFRETREEQMGNDFFGLSYRYDYGFELDLSDGVCAPEAYLGGEFSAGLDVLQEHVELIDVAARIDSNDASNDGLLVDVHASVLNQPLFDPFSVDDQGLGGDQHRWSAIVEGSEGIDVEGSHDIDQTLATARFVIVFVPVSISAGIAADIGFRASLDVAAEGFGVPNECPELQVGGELTPFARASGFVEAGIDIGIAAAGIRGELTILEAELPFRPSVGIETDASVDDDYENLAAELKLTFDIDARLRLRTLDGTISAFVRAGVCPFFCVRAEVDIIDWRGPSFDRPLYRQSWDVDLGLLAEVVGE